MACGRADEGAGRAAGRSAVVVAAEGADSPVRTSSGRLLAAASVLGRPACVARGAGLGVGRSGPSSSPASPS